MSQAPPPAAPPPSPAGGRVNRLVSLFAGGVFTIHAERLEGDLAFTHVNDEADEAIYVGAGAVSLRLGDGRVSLVEGELQPIPKGLPHGDLVGHADLLVIEGK